MVAQDFPLKEKSQSTLSRKINAIKWMTARLEREGIEWYLTTYIAGVKGCKRQRGPFLNKQEICTSEINHTPKEYEVRGQQRTQNKYK